MENELIELIQQVNPWLADSEEAISPENSYIQRRQTEELLLPD